MDISKISVTTADLFTGRNETGDICHRNCIFSLSFSFSSTAKLFTVFGILLCTAQSKKYENKSSSYSTEPEGEILVFLLVVLVVKIVKSEVRTINSKEIRNFQV